MEGQKSHDRFLQILPIKRKKIEMAQEQLRMIIA